MYIYICLQAYENPRFDGMRFERTYAVACRTYPCRQRTSSNARMRTRTCYIHAYTPTRIIYRCANEHMLHICMCMLTNARKTYSYRAKCGTTRVFTHDTCLYTWDTSGQPEMKTYANRKETGKRYRNAHAFRDRGGRQPHGSNIHKNSPDMSMQASGTLHIGCWAGIFIHNYRLPGNSKHAHA